MKTWNYASLEDLMANVSEVTMAAVKQTVQKTNMLPYNKIVHRIQGMFEMEAMILDQLKNEMAMRDAAREDLETPKAPKTQKMKLVHDETDMKIKCVPDTEEGKEEHPEDDPKKMMYDILKTGLEAIRTKEGSAEG